MVRAAPMLPFLYLFFEDLKNRLIARGDASRCGVVFVYVCENSIHGQTLNDQLRVARKRLGIEKILTPYGSRHAVATQIARSGQLE